jgi:hypothetical protein
VALYSKYTRALTFENGCQGMSVSILLAERLNLIYRYELEPYLGKVRLCVCVCVCVCLRVCFSLSLSLSLSLSVCVCTVVHVSYQRTWCGHTYPPATPPLYPHSPPMPPSTPHPPTPAGVEDRRQAGYRVAHAERAGCMICVIYPPPTALSPPSAPPFPCGRHCVCVCVRARARASVHRVLCRHRQLVQYVFTRSIRIDTH